MLNIAYQYAHEFERLLCLRALATWVSDRHQGGQRTSCGSRGGAHPRVKSGAMPPATHGPDLSIRSSILDLAGSGGELTDQVRSARCGDGGVSRSARRSLERGYPSRSVMAVGFAGASKASTESPFIV